MKNDLSKFESDELQFVLVEVPQFALFLRFIRKLNILPAFVVHVLLFAVNEHVSVFSTHVVVVQDFVFAFVSQEYVAANEDTENAETNNADDMIATIFLFNFIINNLSFCFVWHNVIIHHS